MDNFILRANFPLKTIAIAFFLTTALYGEVAISILVQRQFINARKERDKTPFQETIVIALSCYLVSLYARTCLRLTVSFLTRFGFRRENVLLTAYHLTALAIAFWKGFRSPLNPNFVFFLLYSTRIIWHGEETKSLSVRSLQMLGKTEDEYIKKEPEADIGSDLDGGKIAETSAIVRSMQEKAQPSTNIGTDYQYNRLCDRNSIRLLSLKSSEIFDAPLVCHVFEVSLQNAPKYAALSYAWGSGKASVLCNGLSINVTPNCAQAMRRIREDRVGLSDINLWIDAICIDQGNTPEALAEKTQQLLIMGDVYKSASRVIAWVGEEDACSRRVYDFFASVGDAFRRDYKGETDKVLAWKKAESVAAKSLQVWPLFKEDFGFFFQRPWFTRMWTIQEVTLPSPGRVRLICGNCSLPFEYIRLVWQILTNKDLISQLSNLDRAVALQFYLADALALKRDYPAANTRKTGVPLITDLTQLSLSSIMQATRLRACSNAKDKFFALYGIIQELEIKHTVDASRYAEMTVTELFQAVFESCAILDGNLSVLRLCQFIDQPRVSHESSHVNPLDLYGSFPKTRRGSVVLSGPHKWRASLPSFVPDWTHNTHGDADDQEIYISRSVLNRVSSDHFSLDLPRTRTLFRHFNPCDTTLYPHQFYARKTIAKGFVGDRSTLAVRARILGRITSVGTVGSHKLFRQTIMSSFLCAGWRRNWPVSNRSQSIRNRPEQPFFVLALNASIAAIVESLRNRVANFVLAPFIYYSQMFCSVFDLLCLTQFPLRLIAYSFYARILKKIVCWSWSMWPVAGKCVEVSNTSIVHSLRNLLPSLYTTLYLTYLRDPSFWTAHFFWIWNRARDSAQYYLLRSHNRRNAETKMLVVLALLIMSLFMPLIQAQALFLDIEPLSSFIITTIISILEVFRCIREFGREILGSEMFKKRNDKTTGLTFYTTDTGITGNSAGPLRLDDFAVIIEETRDAIVLRALGDKFQIVGKAYVGNKIREELIDNTGAWETIRMV